MKAIAPAHPRAFPWLVAAALPLLGLTLLGSCAAPQRPAPAPLPRPAPPAVQPAPQPLPARPAANWRDLPITAGDWRWAVVDGKSTATFGPASGTPLVRLSCERFLGEVRLARAATRSGAATGHVPMAVTTTTGTRPLLSEPTIAVPGWIITQIRASDPVLDAIAFSRGRFALDVAGEVPLYLPSWPEVSRVVEDCRQGNSG